MLQHYIMFPKENFNIIIMSVDASMQPINPKKSTSPDVSNWILGWIGLDSFFKPRVESGLS